MVVTTNVTISSNVTITGNVTVESNLELEGSNIVFGKWIFAVEINLLGGLVLTNNSVLTLSSPLTIQSCAQLSGTLKVKLNESETEEGQHSKDVIYTNCSIGDFDHLVVEVILFNYYLIFNLSKF